MIEKSSTRARKSDFEKMAEGVRSSQAEGQCELTKGSEWTEEPDRYLAETTHKMFTMGPTVPVCDLSQTDSCSRCKNMESECCC